jgi:ferredoxin
MSVSISVDLQACIGAGQCALVAAELFDQDDDGLVVLLDEAPDGSLLAAARRAASLCPARAIALQEWS